MVIEMNELVKTSKTFKVLYVEDNKKARESTLLMFDNFFEDITVAVNGYEGLEKFKQNKELKKELQFNIIISDINMPKMNGIDMIKEIRDIDSMIDIIIMSAYSDKSYLAEAIKLNLVGYLYKPIEFDEFINILSKAIISIKRKHQHTQRIDVMEQQNINSEYLLNLYGDNVIASMTDLKGIITFASNAYEDISGYTREELLGLPHNIVRHPDMPKAAFKDLWETIKSGKIWEGDVINLKKDGGYYWVKATITPQRDKDGNTIAYASIREDITMKKEIEILHSQVTNMLDNIDEGFLIFDKDLKINKSYSKKCLEILNQEDIAGKNISEVLFSNDIKVKEIFDYGYSELLNTNDCLSKDLFLTLLPVEHKDKNIFSIKYKILENDECLVLLSDITLQKKLEETILHEQQMQKMIIAIATHQDEAIQLGESYNKFLNIMEDYVNNDSNEDRNSAKLKRDLHTFKGLFAQHEMLYTTKAIHKVESIIENPIYCNKQLISKLKQKLERAFKNDLKVISDILGKKFLSSHSYITVEKDQIKSVSSKTRKIIESNRYNKEDLLDLLEEIDQMNDVPFYNMINIYTKTVANISTSIGKDMYPLEIIGDKKLLVSDSFKNFTDSLIHVFRNAMVHGIEFAEERIALDKDQYGKILCSYELVDENIILEISDDGRGIDPLKIIEKAIDQKLIDQEQALQLEEHELLQLIFTTGFTTSEDLNQLSGRGVGLESVKYELSQFNGTIEIENTLGSGLKFIFTIPYKKVGQKDIESTSSDVSVLLDSISSTTKSFLLNDLGIELIDISSSKDIHLDKYFATVKFSGDIEVFCIVTISDELIDSIFSAFVAAEVSDKEKQEMIITLPDEIVNTVAGLAISKFPEKYKNLVMSEPIELDMNIIKALVENNLSETKKIQTVNGSLACTIIIINKD